MEQKNDRKGRLPILRERLNILLGDSTVTDFAEKVGITRQTMGFYLNGDRIPDSETLRQICEKCKVSSDWLLGLSDDRERIPAAVDKLGLSERAVKNISRYYHARHFENRLSGLNLLLECKFFATLTSEIYCLKNKVQNARNIEKSFDSDEPTIGDAVFTRDVMYNAAITEARELIFGRYPALKNQITIFAGADSVKSCKADLIQTFDRLVSKICDYDSYMDEVDTRNAKAEEEWNSEEWRGDSFGND